MRSQCSHDVETTQYGYNTDAVNDLHRFLEVFEPGFGTKSSEPNSELELQTWSRGLEPRVPTSKFSSRILDSNFKLNSKLNSTPNFLNWS